MLPFRDAIYRGALYLSDDDLFGAPSESESSLPDEIVASLDLAPNPDPATRFYAPLGVGLHVDHQLIFRVGAALAAGGWDVWFYEDIPYAMKPNALESRLDAINESMPLEPVARVSAEVAWEPKLDAILSYPSQLETVFRNYVGVGTTRREISDALGTYARRVGEGSPAERFWRFSDASIQKGS